MSKVYLRIELDVLVDTDLESVDDIVDNLDIDVHSSTENVEVYQTEVNNFYTTK